MVKKKVSQPGSPVASTSNGASRQRAQAARTGLVASGVAPKSEADADSGEFPKAMYRKRKVSAAYPMGYQVTRVKSAEEQAALDKKVWKDSPTALYAKHPDPHDAPPPDPDDLNDE